MAGEESADTKKEAKKTDSYEHSQNFNKIGFLEAVNGDLVLRGRDGERDHLYPLDKAIRRYDETCNMITAMLRSGLRGWDTLMDIAYDFEAKILEAVRQRRSMNIPTEQAVLEFAAKHENRSKEKPVGA